MSTAMGAKKRLRDFFLAERNLNPKAVCIKRSQEEKPTSSSMPLPANSDAGRLTHHPQVIGRVL